MAYSRIADIEFKPEVFGTFPNPDIRAAFSFSSARHAERGGISLCHEKSGFALYASQDFHLNRSFWSDKNICTHVFLESGSMHNYLDFAGFVPGKNLYYFSNVTDENKIEATAKFKVVKSELLKVVAPSVYLASAKDPVSVRNVGGKIMKVPVSFSAPGQAVDLSKLPEGKYTIYSGEEKAETVYLVKQRSQPAIVIELSLGSLPPEGMSYSIEFDSLTTRWRYLIVDVNKKYSDFSILSDAGISFAKNNVSHVFSNGTESCAYESDVAIPRNILPAPRFSLVGIDKENMDKREIISFLPSPAPEQLNVSQGSGSPAKYSEIIIYV